MAKQNGTTQTQPKPSANDGNEFYVQPDPPGPDETEFMMPGDVDVIPFESDKEEEPSNIKSQIQERMNALYAEDDATKADVQKRIENVDNQPEPAQQSETPQQSTDSESQANEGDEIDGDDFKFPEMETAIEVNREKQTAGVDDNVDIDGIVKKYIPDIDDDSIEAVAPLGKAMKGLQRQNTEQAQEIATLREKLAAQQEQPPTEQPPEVKQDDGDAGKVEKPLPTEAPTEQELEAIVEAEGFSGLYKRIVEDTAKLQTEKAEPKQSEQPVKIDPKVSEHNAKLITDRARNLLRDRAIAQKDRTAFQKYDNKDYQLTEAEFMEAQTLLDPEIRLIREHLRPDEDGRLSEQSLDIARKAARFDAEIKRAERRGYERALADKTAMQPKRRTVQSRNMAPASQVRKKISVPANASPYEIQKIVEGIPAKERASILDKYKAQGLF